MKPTLSGLGGQRRRGQVRPNSRIQSRLDSNSSPYSKPVSRLPPRGQGPLPASFPSSASRLPNRGRVVTRHEAAPPNPCSQSTGSERAGAPASMTTLALGGPEEPSLGCQPPSGRPSEGRTAPRLHAGRAEGMLGGRQGGRRHSRGSKLQIRKDGAVVHE